jgi:UDP-N-acetylmuramate--alanine ligase
MDISKYSQFYFLGAGGIGMSGLIRYLLKQSAKVGGYDRTPSPLTEELRAEGALLHFEDDVNLIPKIFLDRETTLVIWTPAIPDQHSELNFFRFKGFTLVKRAELLGLIANLGLPIAVAGTHAKTSVSSHISHLLMDSGKGCTAFLGGITKNYQSNFLFSENSPVVVAEADEFDRSFLHLHPWMAVITSTDPDHLDIYHNHANLLEAFAGFTRQIKPGGLLLIKKGLGFTPEIQPGVKMYTYAPEGEADFSIQNLQTGNGISRFDVRLPDGNIMVGFSLSLPGFMNVENSLAAIAIGYLSGLSQEALVRGVGSFLGVKRRFDYILRFPSLVYIDDYAHHPEELAATIKTAREAHPGMKLSGIFQPHLFSRTRDFAQGFADSLSLLDEVFLLDIYPAREEPIPGIDSGIIFRKLSSKHKWWCHSFQELISHLSEGKPELVMTLGAGDIDRFVEPLSHWLEGVYQGETQ